MCETNVFNPDELRRRVDRWIENGGKQQLVLVVQMAARTRADVRDSLRVDYETLHHPMTI
ncbi:MAG: hypothetical protein KA066_00720 [Candidatus Pacebacteria bacterium]|nr:hypothetical protein [Candidatus Paceibacterota bacterium]